MNRRLVMTMIAMSMGVIVIAMDITAMNVALSAIERAFDSDVTETLWVINGYLLAFGMLIVTVMYWVSGTLCYSMQFLRASPPCSQSSSFVVAGQRRLLDKEETSQPDYPLRACPYHAGLQARTGGMV